MPEKRSGVLARAGRGSVSTRSPKGNQLGRSHSFGGGSGEGAFSLTEVTVPDHRSNLHGRASAKTAAAAAKPEDHHADGEHVGEHAEGDKLVLRGDPVAPLTAFRFDLTASTPLPATVKTDLLLSMVQASVAQHVPPEGQQAWDAFFASSENRRLVEDLFWYRYLTDHQVGLEEEATKFMTAKIFYRMSASFVHLFRRTPKRHLDHILRVYPGALSQAVYLAFFVACPHECVALDGRWKTMLERDVSGWCTGMPARISTFRSWAVSHFDVTPEDRYPAHVLTLVEKQLEREGVATSRHLQASKQKKRRKHSNAASAAAAAAGSTSVGGGIGGGGAGGGEGHHEALQLGNKTVKRRPTLPLTRPSR